MNTNKAAQPKKSSPSSVKTSGSTNSPPKATTLTTAKSPRKQSSQPVKKTGISTTKPNGNNNNNNGGTSSGNSQNTLKNTGKSPSFASVKISSKFNVNELKLLRDYFAEMDEDGDGVVSRRQFKMAHGRKKKESEKEQFPFLSDSFFDMVDADGSETITFREFLKAIYPATTKQERDVVMQYLFPKKEVVEEEEKVLTEEQKAELTAIFKMYDKDGSGNLTFSELRHAVSDLGMNKEEVEKMFLSLDTNGDNMVSLDEFLDGMKSNYLGEPTTPKTPKPASTVI